MSDVMTEGELAKVRDWAKDQLADGSAQLWATFLLARLSETINSLLAGMAATQAIDCRRAADPSPLRLVTGGPTRALGIDAAEHVADHLPPPRMIGARVAEPVT
jgi:hypothetical protein